jgi:hypothetical protein
MSLFQLKDWMNVTRPETGVAELVVLQERPGKRSSIEVAIQETVTDHLAGLDIVRRIGGYKKTLAHIRNKLPTAKRVRSGDFGEILASEYIDQCTEYRVPIKRLQWKDDRNTTMRGNDVIAIQKHIKRWRLLKAESKSRASLSERVVGEAVEGLDKHVGRPNPSSLAFISSRLRGHNRDEEAAVFEEFQSRPPKPTEIEHLVFTLSGNNPTNHLRNHIGNTSAKIRRHLVGCVIADHQQFINTVFDRIHAGNSRRDRRSP